MIHRGNVRHVVVASLFVALVTGLLAVHLATRARGADESRCERFETASVIRSRVVTGTGTGERVVVIGDSYAAGLGLDTPGTRGRPGSTARFT